MLSTRHFLFLKETLNRMNYRTFLALLFLVCVLAPVSANASSGFDEWKKEFSSYAVSKGIKQSLINKALPYMRFNKTVIRLDKKQPEKKITFKLYLKRVLPASRVKLGRALLRKNFKLLSKISRRYGVKPSVIVALWGMESSFGAQMGGFNVLGSLSTLAYDGRRAKFFKRELLNAFRLMQENNVRPAAMQGSWAGAMGQSQFMPSTYRHYAVDYNRDGKRDIWTDKRDIFASIARYLAAEGWEPGFRWGREVKVPNKKLSRYVSTKEGYSIDFWRQKGVKTRSGKRLPYADIEAYLVQPDGVGGRSFLVYDNYLSLMKWNRSTYFATAVGLFSDKLE